MFVGTGSPAQALDFQSNYAPSVGVYVDPHRRAYAILDLHRGIFRVFNWRLIAHTWRAYRSGFRQGRRAGDAYQLGGVVAIDSESKVIWLEREQSAGDPLNIDATILHLKMT